MTKKQEALNAIDTARKMLDSPEPMDGLRFSLLRATLDHAASCLEQVTELKRPRKAKPS